MKRTFYFHLAFILIAFCGAGAADSSSLTVSAVSPTEAAGAITQLKRAHGGKLPGPVTIEIAPGIHRLSEPLVLTPEHSGTREAPITWTGKGGKPVIFSGGDSIRNWSETELNGRKVWAATVPAGSNFRSMWVGQESRPRARHPNRSYLAVPEAPEPGAKWEIGQDHFQYAAGDVPSFLIDDAEVIHFTRWVESRLPVASHDSTRRELRFRLFTTFKTGKGDLYRLENAPEFLDEPGEWYFRRATDQLFYLPKPGETITTFEAIIPRLTQLVQIEGKPEKNELVENVTFRGITFSHCEWRIPSDGISADGRPRRAGYVQAAYGVSSAVQTQGARHCTFDRCRFVHLGSYALELSRGSQNNSVTRCTFEDLGAGGVRIGELVQRSSDTELTRANVITDCTVAHYGKLFKSAIGIFIGQSADNRVEHCLIHDGYYSGISAGWTWGYGPSLARGNVIEHNHIHHIGQLSDGEGPLLSDMGAIYTVGVRSGTVIRFNRFHDISGRVYGGWGIYFDEGSSDVLAEKNLVYNTTHGEFHQHYGRENIVRNNILAFGRDVQVYRTKPEAHRSFTFERNLVIWDTGEGIGGNWSNLNATFRLNQYWFYGHALGTFAKIPFEQWRRKGMDEGSVIADPGLEDPAARDFRFKPSCGPAASIGFEMWNFSDVGPRTPN